MQIKRTNFANRPRAVTWVADPWGWETAPLADTVHAREYPTHSPVLGPDGMPLEYEARPAIGFDLSRKG